MEHSEMLEKIWEHHSTPKGDFAHLPIDPTPIAFSKPDKNGWKLFFYGPVDDERDGLCPIGWVDLGGSSTLNEAIERAYHKIFDVGCWSWDGENWVDENLHTILHKKRGRFYDFGTDKTGPLPFQAECLPDLIRLLEADPGLEGPHRKKEITQ